LTSRQTRNAFADVRWNKASNKVSISYHYENLPYRPTVQRVPGTNPTNPFTPVYPEVVVAGALSGFNVPEGFRVDTLVTNRLLPYTAAELSGAYVRPLVPGVSAC
jgi:hypothetical protein